MTLPLADRVTYRAMPCLLFFLLVLVSPAGSAHHSGALFYEMGEAITLTGKVLRFNFRNPHAIVELEVTNEAGEIERWTCETSAPSALRRRGWSQQTLMEGEVVTLRGVPSRDGSKLMRITGVTRADGTEVGVSSRTDD